MAVNEFLQFDSQNTNSLTNEEYTNDTVRINGISSGKARSDIMNKSLRNTSTFVAAFGEFLKSKNIDAPEDMAVLQANLTALFNTYLQNSSGVVISETTRSLYSLAVGDANVDKALQKTMQGGLLNALLTGWSKTIDTGDISDADTLLKALSKLSNFNKVIYGTYTGDGTTNRQIFLGRDTKFVIVRKNNDKAFFIKTPNTSLGQTGGTTNSNSVSIANSTGFLVSKQDYSNYQEADSSNQTGAVYDYIAITA